MKSLVTTCVASLCAAIASSAVFAGNPGDEPSSPVVLAGNSFLYDSALFTNTPYATFAQGCFADGNGDFGHDAWVCWTANCTGMVTVSMCGGGGGGAGGPDGTRMAMYIGCADPSADPVVVPAFCCSDNVCGKDAEIRCEVVCGQQYLFRFGLDPGTNPPLVRNISFVCEGKPCDTGGGEPCATCCTRAPIVSNFNAPTLVGTSWEDQPDEKVVHVFDATAWSSQTPGPWNPPVYEHASWTRANLGNVYGVTLDGAGNIYVAHTGVFSSDFAGTVGGGGPGAIYKLDTGTGLPTLFCTLPNTNACAPATQCAPGIGNLTYSCAHDCIYASNMEDGRIYRISMTGAKLETYDFGDQAIESGLADPNDSVGPAPLGRRVFGVGVANDRLYFSVWREDQSTPSATASNEIWSIPITAGTGAFAGTVPTLEVTMPPRAGGIYSNPVADIAFDGECCMFAAERSMYGIDQTGAHDSRLMKFCQDAAGGGWAWSGQVFETGIAGGLQDSCAGGVGVDLAPGGLVWTTSDAMSFTPTYYGIIGLPVTGGVNNQGLLIDMNSNTVDVDKTYVGSVEVACRVADVCNASITAKCHLGPDGLPDGQYELSITIYNGMENAAANLLLLPDLGTFVHLNPPLQPGQSTKVTIITDQFTPGIHTMDIGLFDSNCPGCHCCGVMGVEFEVPDCYCMLIEELEVTCHDDRDASTYWYDVSFVLRNISPAIARHLFIVPQDLTVTTVPQYVQLPFLLPGQTFPINFTIQFPGAPPVDADGNWHTTLSLAMFQANFNLCCKLLVEFTGPINCASPVLADLNNDLKVDGGDLGILLGDWGVVPFGGCLSDLNGDGVVDGGDLGIMLGQWGD